MTLKEVREILGLELIATRQEIKAACRRLARRWHPDRAPKEEEAAFRARMQEVNAAYQCPGGKHRAEDGAAERAGTVASRC